MGYNYTPKLKTPRVRVFTAFLTLFSRNAGYNEFGVGDIGQHAGAFLAPGGTKGVESRAEAGVPSFGHTGSPGRSIHRVWAGLPRLSERPTANLSALRFGGGVGHPPRESEVQPLDSFSISLYWAVFFCGWPGVLPGKLGRCFAPIPGVILKIP